VIALLLLGIVVPAALLVAAVRRWIAPVPWRTALLFLLMTLAFLHGAVFTTELPVPVDEAARGYPWHGVAGDVVARNPLTNDTVKLFLPWMQVAREELAHGRAPLWNRYSFAGYPLLANGESAPFSPLFLATLFIPLPKQIVAMAALKIFAALLFTWLFLKREQVSDAAATFGAVVFAFSTVMTVFLYYSTASVVAFLPAAAFALCNAIDKQTKASIVLVAIVIATLLANGHPESVLHISVGCGGILVIEWSRGLAVSRPRRDDEHKKPRDPVTARLRNRLLAPLLGVILGLALGAPTWVPVLEQVRISERFATLRSMPQLGPMPFTATWGIISPNGFGNPLRHNWSWMYNYAAVAISYAGLLPLTLFLAAAISRRTAARERMLVVLAAIFFLVAMDWSVVGHALNAIPPFNIVANDKLRFVSIFLLAVVTAKWLDVGRTVRQSSDPAPITAKALDMHPADATEHAGGVPNISRWQAPQARRHRIPIPKESHPGRGAGGLSATPAGVEETGPSYRWRRAVGACHRLISGTPPAWVHAAEEAGLYLSAFVVIVLALYVYVNRSNLMRPIDLLGICAIIGFLLIPRRFRAWGAVALACMEFFAFNAGFNALVDAKYFRPPLPIVNALRAHAPREPFRVAGLNWTFLPNASAQYGLEDVRGSDPMAFADYDRFLQRFTIAEAGSWVRRIVDANRPELDFLNVRFLLAEPDALPGGRWRLIYQGVDGTLWENPAVLPRFFARAADVRNVRSTAPGEFAMTVVSPRPTLVESSEPLGPGRRVYVRGRLVPLRHIENAFIGFEVPAGVSEVRVVYRPITFYASCVISLLAIISMAVIPRSTDKSVCATN
jgi:hypothetical protein